MEVTHDQHRARKFVTSHFNADHANKKKKKGVFKRIVKAVATGGGSEIVHAAKKNKKLGNVLKNVATGGAYGVVKNRKKIGKAIKKVAQVSALAPLLPFTGLMKKALKKKGVAAPKGIADLTEVFYNNIVKKSSSFESHYLYGKTLERDGYNDDHIVGEIITGVLNFIKGLITKKKQQKAGSPVELSPVEDAIAVEANGILKNIDQKGADSGVDLGEDLPGSSSKDNDGSDTERPSDGKRRGKKDNTILYLAGGGAVLVAILLTRK